MSTRTGCILNKKIYYFFCTPFSLFSKSSPETLLSDLVCVRVRVRVRVCVCVCVCVCVIIPSSLYFIIIIIIATYHFPHPHTTSYLIISVQFSF